MKRMLFAACLAGILVTGLSAVAHADATDWWLGIQASQNSYDPGFAVIVGTQTGSLDAFDATSSVDFNDLATTPPDVLGDPQPRIAINRGSVYGSGSLDIEAPLAGPGDVKTWANILVVPGSGYNGSTFNLTLGGVDSSMSMPASVGGSPVEYKLTLTNNVAGYAGPTSWIINPQGDPGSAQAISFPTLNKATTAGAWGTFGYNFTFTASVVPEPGSFLALGAGLVGFAGLLRRRS
jgi:hypothetical protein